MYMLIEKQNANEIRCSDYSFFIEWVITPFFKELLLIKHVNVNLFQFSQKMVPDPLYGKKQVFFLQFSRRSSIVQDLYLHNSKFVI